MCVEVKGQPAGVGQCRLFHRMGRGDLTQAMMPGNRGPGLLSHLASHTKLLLLLLTVAVAPLYRVSRWQFPVYPNVYAS